jgi:DNA-binding CsgD family transcriptional regulator
LATRGGIDADALRQRSDSLFTRQPTHVTGWNPRRPEPSQRNKVVSVVDYLGWEALQRLPMFQHVIAPMRLGRYHQLRALSCEGECLLAWVGVFREEPFTAREKAMLQALLPAVRRRLEIDVRLKQAPIALAALDRVLEAVGAPAFVVRAGPVVVHVNEAGRVLLERDRVGTLEGLQTSISGYSEAPARATLIRLVGLPEHYLCIWRAAQADFLPRIATFARRHGLTPRQTDVLMRVVHGKPNKVIAAELGRADVTIELHVGAILAKTDCSNRAELAARFWADIL